MATVVSARVTLGAPFIQRFAGQVRLNIPLMNIGESALQGVQITSITYGSATRQSPPNAPIVLGTLGASSSTTFAGRFSDAGLADNANLLLTVRGSYLVAGVAYGLTVSRYVRVPAAGSFPADELRASLAVTTTPNYWSYTLTNNESAGSPQRIATLSLTVNAPVTVTGTPAGWEADADGMTYVTWVASDLLPPYPNHVAPGASLSGFQLMSPRTSSESTGASLVAWNHAADDAGKVAADYTLTPSRA